MVKKYSKKEILTIAKNIFLVILGSAILAFGTAVFIVPYNLITGGLSGLAIVLEKIIPLNLGIDTYVTILTWGLFVVGLIFLGKDFAMKTFISSIFYPITLSLFMNLVNENFMGGFFYIKNSQYPDIAIFLAAVFGGILIGVGCAVTFVGGGSTGGVDILAFLICKIFKRLKTPVVIFAIDAIIIVMGMFIINDLVITMLGIVSAFVCSYFVDYIFLGSTKAFVANIISDNPDEITQQVIEKLERTTTIYSAVGGYTKTDKKVIMVSFNIREYSTLMNIIHKADKNAFVTIHSAHEISGEGWTR